MIRNPNKTIVKRLLQECGLPVADITQNHLENRQKVVGAKIVLFKYAGPTVGWWSRVYDAKTSANTNPF